MLHGTIDYVQDLEQIGPQKPLGYLPKSIIVG